MLEIQAMTSITQQKTITFSQHPQTMEEVLSHETYPRHPNKGTRLVEYTMTLQAVQILQNGEDLSLTLAQVHADYRGIGQDGFLPTVPEEIQQFLAPSVQSITTNAHDAPVEHLTGYLISPFSEKVMGDLIATYLEQHSPDMEYLESLFTVTGSISTCTCDGNGTCSCNGNENGKE